MSTATEKVSKNFRNTDKYTLTISQELIEKIKILANKKRISLNAFILLSISQYL